MLFGLFATLSLTLDVQLSTSLTRLQIGPGPHGPAALLEGAPRDRPGGGLQPFARPPAPSTCLIPLPEPRGYPLTGQEESLLSQLFFVPRDRQLPFYKTVPASCTKSQPIATAGNRWQPLATRQLRQLRWHPNRRAQNSPCSNFRIRSCYPRTIVRPPDHQTTAPLPNDYSHCSPSYMDLHDSQEYCSPHRS